MSDDASVVATPRPARRERERRRGEPRRRPSRQPWRVLHWRSGSSSDPTAAGAVWPVIAERRRPARWNGPGPDHVDPDGGPAAEHPGDGHVREPRPEADVRSGAERGEHAGLAMLLLRGAVVVSGEAGPVRWTGTRDTSGRSAGDQEARAGDESCDPPCRPITPERGASLHPMMPHGRCKQPRSLKLHPESHFHLHPLCRRSSSISTGSGPNTPAPRAADGYRGEEGSDHAETCRFPAPAGAPPSHLRGRGRSPGRSPSGKGEQALAAPERPGCYALPVSEGTLTKAALVEEVVDAAGLTKKRAEIIVETVFGSSREPVSQNGRTKSASVLV